MRSSSSTSSSTTLATSVRRARRASRGRRDAVVHAPAARAADRRGRRSARVGDDVRRDDVSCVDSSSNATRSNARSEAVRSQERRLPIDPTVTRRELDCGIRRLVRPQNSIERTASRDQAVRLRLRLRHDRPAPLPLGRAVDHLHDHRVRLHQDRRPVHDQQLDDAAEAEPGHARADPRPLRERLRRPVRADDDPQGPAHRLQPRPAGRQAHRLPRLRHGQQLPHDGGRDRERAPATTRSASSRRWTAASSTRRQPRGIPRDEGHPVPHGPSHRRHARRPVREGREARAGAAVASRSSTR